MKDFKPYYVVIFTSLKKSNDDGYAEMGEKMANLAKTQPGYLGMDSVRNEIGITLSYWETHKDIANWKAQTDHLLAQSLGRKNWYEWYNVKVCKVEREYSFGNM
jgi:heme-degrading monooxygenase HmoA